MTANAYAQQTDLWNVGIAQSALSSLSSTQIDAVLESKARFIDSFLSEVGPLPLSSWGADLRECNAVLAAAQLLRGLVGVSPDDPATDWLREQVASKESWLRDVARGVVVPVGLVFSELTPPPAAAPQVYTTPRRGW